MMVSMCVRGLSFIESLFGGRRILELRPNHLFPKQRDWLPLHLSGSPLSRLHPSRTAMEPLLSIPSDGTRLHPE